MPSFHLNASDAVLDLWQLSAPLDALFLTSMHLLLCLISLVISMHLMRSLISGS